MYYGDDTKVSVNLLPPDHRYEVRVCGEYVNGEFRYRSPWTVNTFIINAFSGLIWNENTKTANVDIEDTKATVPSPLESDYDWATVAACTGLKIVSNSGEFGYFEVIIGGSNIYGVVGMVSSDFSFHRLIIAGIQTVQESVLVGLVFSMEVNVIRMDRPFCDFKWIPVEHLAKVMWLVFSWTAEVMVCKQEESIQLCTSFFS